MPIVNFSKKDYDRLISIKDVLCSYKEQLRHEIEDRTEQIVRLDAELHAIDFTLLHKEELFNG